MAGVRVVLPGSSQGDLALPLPLESLSALRAACERHWPELQGTVSLE